MVENRLYIVNVLKAGAECYAEKIACFDLRYMGKEWEEIFTNDIDFQICIDGEETSKDKYGEILKSGKIEDVILWLESEAFTLQWKIPFQNLDRRLHPLLKMLKSFDLSQWEDLRIVNYRY